MDTKSESGKARWTPAPRSGPGRGFAGVTAGPFCLWLFAFGLLISLFGLGGAGRATGTSFASLRTGSAGAAEPAVAVPALPSAFRFLPSSLAGPAPAALGGAAGITPARGAFVANPGITIAGATADSAATSTLNQHEAQVEFNFGTVSGTYASCTAQAKTSFDGTNWLTLGSAAAVTVTSNTLNAWTILAQAPTTSVTTSSVSSTAALGFGQISKFTFACSGYGASAPVTITVIYR